MDQKKKVMNECGNADGYGHKVACEHLLDLQFDDLIDGNFFQVFRECFSWG